MREMYDADVIVVDEAHCLKTFRAINEDKAKVLDILDETLTHMVERRGKPIFLLTSTPSVEQIPVIEDRKSSKFSAFLTKDRKKISIHKIDADGLQKAVKAHDKVLIFMDHRKEVKEAGDYLESAGIDHKIFMVTKDQKPEEKRKIEREIRTLEEYVIIGTSAVASGLNIDLDTIIFTNRVMNQETVYQVMGRLRIINKPHQVHPIYIVKQPVHRIPYKADSMDLFEFVSTPVLIKYIAALYDIVVIKDHARSTVTSFNRLNKIDDNVALIKGTKHISEFYRLPEVQQKKLYLIPNEVIEVLGKSGWLDQNRWANMPYRDIARLSTEGKVYLNGGKVKCRNPENGYYKPVSHFFDPLELTKIIKSHSDRKHFLKKLPEKVRNFVKPLLENDIGRIDESINEIALGATEVIESFA
jgi:hypothetical protein